MSSEVAELSIACDSNAYLMVHGIGIIRSGKTLQVPIGETLLAEWFYPPEKKETEE